MDNKKKGILFILLGAFSFATMSLFVRLSGDLPFIQKTFFRNIIAVAFSLSLIIKTGGNFSYKKENLKFLFLRSICGTVGIFCNFYAIEHLLLADAAMIAKLSPFFVILFSFIILKENIKSWQLVSILIAFTGSIFIVNPMLIEGVFTGVMPESSLGSIPALAGIIGAMAAGMAYTYIRKLSFGGERGPFIIFFFSVFSTICCLPFLFFDYQPMTVEQILFLLGAGLAASSGQFAITSAYSYAPAKEISIFDYSQIVFSAFYGLLFFGDIPSPYSLIGYVLIISVAVFMFFKGRKN